MRPWKLNHRLHYVTLGVALIAAHQGLSEEYSGFTEPYRFVRVASPESGIVRAVHVREGEVVKKGQLLASLDDELHTAMLAIAEQAMEASGGLRTAEAELRWQRQRLEKLQAAREKGFARQEEVDRAAADVAISAARLQAAQEDRLIKRREYEKIKVQLERRQIRASLAGSIKAIHKREGEYVGPSDPHMFDLVKLDPLLTRFSLPSHRARELAQNQAVRVYVEPLGVVATANVEFIGPVTDAESGTVEVKARLANQRQRFFSGEQCVLQLNAAVHPAARRPQSLPVKGRAPAPVLQ